MPKATALVRTPSRVGAPAEGRELRARGQRTVRKLLDAGIDVFGKKGYFPARVDDIVKVAKTSHGTFYLYFANKEDLFRALALDVAEEITTLVDSLEPLRADEAGFEQLRGWLGQFAAVHARYSPVIKAWTEAEIDASEFGRMGTNVLSDLVVRLAERIAQSPAVVADPQLAALALVAMIERTNYYALNGQAAGDDVVDTLTEIAFASLFGAHARQPTSKRRAT
jgi:AcrR family transcriptional regulator